MSATTLAEAKSLGPDSPRPAGPRLDKLKTSWNTLPLLIPAAILLAALFIGPVIYSIYLGFTNLQLVGPHAQNYQVTGLDNVHRLLSDTVFHQSVWLTLLFVLISAILGATLIGLILALAMQSAMKSLRAIVGAVVLVCFMMPPIVVSLCWLAAATVGGVYPALMGNPNADLIHHYPMIIVSAANTWNLSGMAMLLFSAALRNIPADIVESAKMENSTARQRLFKITLPLLRSTITTTMLLITLLALANFAVVYIMTQGGPGTSTMIMPVYSYVQGFTFNNLGYGALIGNVMVLLATVLSIAYVRISRTKP